MAPGIVRCAPCSPTAAGSVPTCPWRRHGRRPSSAPTRSAPTALQVFGDNPTAWRRRAEPPRELPAFRERARRAGHRAAGDPRVVPRSTSPAPSRPSAERSVGLLDERAPGRRGVRRRVRQRPHRLARGTGGRRRARRARRRRSRGSSPRSTTGPQAARLVLENSAGGGFGLGTTRRGARGDRRGDRRPRRGRRGGSASASTRRTPGAPATTCPSRTRSMRFLAAFDARIGLERLVDGPPQRLQVRAAARTLDRHEHVGAGRIGAARAGASPHPPGPRADDATSSRRPGWTRATTRSTSRGPATSRPAGHSPTLPPEAMHCAAAARATAPGRAERRAEGRCAIAGDPREARPDAADRPSTGSRPASAARPRGGSCACRTWRRAGTWDADQGHDMLVLRALVHDGRRPAPRPTDVDRRLPPRRPLLLPARAVRGRCPAATPARGDAGRSPLSAIAAVGVTWWLARSIGGPVAGIVAGLPDGRLGLARSRSRRSSGTRT